MAVVSLILGDEIPRVSAAFYLLPQPFSAIKLMRLSPEMFYKYLNL